MHVRPWRACAAPKTENRRMSSNDQTEHQRFVKALQHEPIPCGRTGCEGSVEVADLSGLHDRVKTFEARCRRCGWHERITGRKQHLPPWDDAALLLMANDHLLHQQPVCPFDDTPVVFTSMPNPRRKARYRVSCFYCGRQAEMDWPPPEARR